MIVQIYVPVLHHNILRPHRAFCGNPSTTGQPLGNFVRTSSTIAFVAAVACALTFAFAGSATVAIIAAPDWLVQVAADHVLRDE